MRGQRLVTGITIIGVGLLHSESLSIIVPDSCSCELLAARHACRLLEQLAVQPARWLVARRVSVCILSFGVDGLDLHNRRQRQTHGLVAVPGTPHNTIKSLIFT